MEIFKRNFVFCVVCCILPSFTWQCGLKQDLVHADIPHSNTVLSIDDFEKYVVDNEMARMYVALTEPLTATPNISSFSSVTKVTGTTTYRLNTIAETRAVNSQCVRSETLLRAVSTSREAFFSSQDSNAVVSFWSSCPTRYIWSMTCSKYYFARMKCLLRHVTLELYVHGTLDDVPLTDISQDLCHATRVKLGAKNFRWFFTYGENVKCRKS